MTYYGNSKSQDNGQEGLAKWLYNAPLKGEV